MSSSSSSEDLLKTRNKEMESYVMKRAFYGTVIGTGASTAGIFLSNRYWPWFKRNSNFPIRSFLMMAGGVAGFAVAFEKSSIYFLHYLDERNYLKANTGSITSADNLREARKEVVKNFAWDNRFRLIGAAWATTMAAVIYKDYRNPYLNTVHKFGHARIAAQVLPFDLTLQICVK
jgi:hypothetical protein